MGAVQAASLCGGNTMRSTSATLNATVQASCETGGDACIQTIMEIGMTLNTLWTKMADDGVKDIVYIRYSDDAGSTADNIRMMGRMPPPICTT